MATWPAWLNDRPSRPTTSVILRFAVDDTVTAAPRFFVKTIEADLPGVPRIGEAVRVPAADFRATLGTFRVEEVIYPLDGTVILQFRTDFQVAAEDHVTELVAAGFRET